MQSATAHVEKESSGREAEPSARNANSRTLDSVVVANYFEIHGAANDTGKARSHLTTTQFSLYLDIVAKQYMNICRVDYSNI
jgi:hypothetical protein